MNNDEGFSKEINWMSLEGCLGCVRCGGVGCMCPGEMLLPDSCSGYTQIMTKCLASFKIPAYIWQVENKIQWNWQTWTITLIWRQFSKWSCKSGFSISRAFRVCVCSCLEGCLKEYWFGEWAMELSSHQKRLLFLIFSQRNWNIRGRGHPLPPMTLAS